MEYYWMYKGSDERLGNKSRGQWRAAEMGRMWAGIKHTDLYFFSSPKFFRRHDFVKNYYNTGMF
jgi:hypothetical protein